jgi:hypothetical protein
MNTITAIVRDGVIVPSEPIDWPNGTEVYVSTCENDVSNGECDDPDDILGDSPEAIARWLAEARSIPPLQLSPEEEAEWNSHRLEQRAFDRARADKREEKLRKMFE